MAISSI